MLTPNQIKQIAETTLKECGDSERGYAVEVEGDKLSISYITRIKYDKEPDPQIQKEPDITVVTESSNTNDYKTKIGVERCVEALIEEIEIKPIEHE